MRVTFGQRRVNNNEIIPLKKAQEEVLINFSGDSQNLYTILMYDPDAAVGVYLHYAVVNAPGGNISKGDTTFEYIPPHPSPCSGMHHYTFLALKQKCKLPGEINTTQRVPFSLNSLIKSAKLTPVEQLVVLVPSPGSSTEPMPCKSRKHEKYCDSDVVWYSGLKWASGSLY